MEVVVLAYAVILLADFWFGTVPDRKQARIFALESAMHNAINMMNEPGVSAVHKKLVFETILEVVRLGQARNIRLVDYGEWRQPPIADREGFLHPWRSVDWYLGTARRKSARQNQLNASYLINLLANEPWRKPENGGQPHYDVLVLNSDIYSGEEDNRFVIGVAVENIGTVISLNRFLSIPDGTTQNECIRTEVMHEIGHVFGLVPEERKTNVEYSLGKHCTSMCSMRQGLLVPNDWVRFTADRFRDGTAFCGECLRDLRAHFARRS